MRTFVIGDPQASFSHFLAILRHQGLLNGADRLRDDVHLISVGDHFDYGLENLPDVAAQGIAIATWLASHPPTQCTFILGNHDTVRVIEFSGVPSDIEFKRAQDAARTLRVHQAATRPGDEQRQADNSAYLREFPFIPTAGYAGRDFSAFIIAQRALVQSLLLRGRCRLASAVTLLDGREALITHAGVTTRETRLLAVATHTPRACALALNTLLAERVALVRSSWTAGANVPLDLAPLNVPASAGKESGGMLFHRPSNPSRDGADLAWELQPRAPRRFDPITLPPGLTQIVGHTGHRKCLEELGSWVTPAAAAHAVGGLRTLRVHAGRVSYDLGVAPPVDDATDLIMVDGEMRHVAHADYPLLEVASINTP